MKLRINVLSIIQFTTELECERKLDRVLCLSSDNAPLKQFYYPGFSLRQYWQIKFLNIDYASRRLENSYLRIRIFLITFHTIEIRRK